MADDPMVKILEAHRIARALGDVLFNETQDLNDAVRAACLLFVSSCLQANWDMPEKRMFELVSAAVQMARKGKEEMEKFGGLQ